MRVERVRYFVTAVRAGSVRQAATRLSVSQSTISEQITALEEELDVILLNRARSGVTATAAGEALMPRFVALLAAERDVVDSAAALTSTYAADIRIGAVPTLVSLVVGPAVSDLRRRYAETRFLLHEAHTEDLVKSVARGRLDFALITLLPDEPISGPVRTRHVTDVPVGAYLPVGHPLADRELSWALLRGEPLVTITEGSALWNLTADRKASGALVATVANLDRMVEMVARGDAVGIGPPHRALSGTDPVCWRPIGDERLGIHVLERRDQPHPRVVREVCQLVCAPLSRVAGSATPAL